MWSIRQIFRFDKEFVFTSFLMIKKTAHFTYFDEPPIRRSTESLLGIVF